MSYPFPINIDRNQISKFSFSNWENTMNAYESLRVNLKLPSFLSLYRADTICPAPKMPFVDLGYFKDQNKEVEIIIQASAMQHEIALEDYYAYFAKTAKEEIINKRLIDNDPDKADFLTLRKFEDSQVWITRKTGFKTWMGKGVFVITLNLSCNETVYHKYADLFYFMMHSFQLKNTPEYTLAEQLRLIARKYPLDFGTYIPFSWKETKLHFDTMVDMRTCFKKKFRGTISGMLNINARKIEEDRKNNYKAMLNTYLEPYVKQGLVIDEINFFKTKKYPNIPNAEECNHNFKISQQGKKIALNIRILIFQVSNCWVYIDVIGFGENQNFEAWAINKRAFQLACSELKTV